MKDKKNQNCEKETAPELHWRGEFPPPGFEQWREAALEALKGAPFDKLVTKTYEGIDLQPLYRREDIQDLPHLGQFPGFGHLVRGNRAGGYLARPWEISQELFAATPEEFNTAARHDLARSQTELNVPLDAATRAGLDPDQAAIGQVGAGGLSLATLTDMETALAGIDLAQTSLFFQAGAVGWPVMAMLFAYAKKQHIPLNRLRGCVECNPLAELAVGRVLPTSLAHAYDEMAALTRYAAQNAPNLQTIGASGYFYHDGGASATQELAFVLAAAVEYLRAMRQRGLDLETIAPRTRLSFSIGPNFFLEIAKLRAARLLWSLIIETFGGSEKAKTIYIHAQTGHRNKTLREPYVNMLRGATEAFAAALGGCDGLQVGPFDETIRPPDEFSRRIARNAQIILAEECDLKRVIDPAGGSYFVEWLTDQVAQKAWAIFQKIESAGGMAKAYQDGLPQKLMTETAEAKKTAFAQGRDVLVGTNKYQNKSEKPLEKTAPDYEAIFKSRCEMLAKYRASADQTLPSQLESLKNRKSGERIERAIEAALSGATLGEISNNLRK